MATKARIKLTPKRIPTLNTPGRYGAEYFNLGLQVVVTKAGTTSKTWVQRLVIDGKRRNAGLGSYPSVPMEEAKRRALANAGAIADNKPLPFGPSRAAKVTNRPTFADAADKVIKLRRPEWSGANVERQWCQVYAEHCKPLNTRAIADITRADVIACLEPLFGSIPTMRKCRQQISAAFEIGLAFDWCQINAAEGIGAALPKKHTVTARESVPASQVADIFKAVADVAQAPLRLGLSFLIHTATRACEAASLRWTDVDFDAKVITVRARCRKEAP